MSERMDYQNGSFGLKAFHLAPGRVAIMRVCGKSELNKLRQWTRWRRDHEPYRDTWPSLREARALIEAFVSHVREHHEAY